MSYILDDEVPRFDNLPNNISVSSIIGKDFSIVNWTEPNVTDNSGVVNMSSTIKPGSPFYIGTTDVKYAAVDPSGNVDGYTFIVRVTGQYKMYVDLESLCSTYIGLPNLHK